MIVMSFFYMFDMFICRTLIIQYSVMLMIARLVACFMGTTDGAIVYAVVMVPLMALLELPDYYCIPVTTVDYLITCLFKLFSVVRLFLMFEM